MRGGVVLSIARAAAGDPAYIRNRQPLAQIGPLNTETQPGQVLLLCDLRLGRLES